MNGLKNFSQLVYRWIWLVNLSVEWRSGQFALLTLLGHSQTSIMIRIGHRLSTTDYIYLILTILCTIFIIEIARSNSASWLLIDTIIEALIAQIGRKLCFVTKFGHFVQSSMVDHCHIQRTICRITQSTIDITGRWYINQLDIATFLQSLGCFLHRYLKLMLLSHLVLNSTFHIYIECLSMLV